MFSVGWDFHEPARLLLERLLGLCDRDPASPTYGCVDRYYWHYRLLDFANARFQEAGLYYCRMLTLEPDLSAVLAPLVEAVATFWAKSRHRDGSVDEAYPWERSFCATAMTTHAVTACMLALETDWGIDLRPSAAWLASRNRDDVANQMAGAAAALFNIHSITGEARWKDAAFAKLRRLAACQFASGAYREYDGADVGYATITLSLLASLHAASGDEDAWRSMRACGGWLEQVVWADGRYDWSVTSRGTQFLYPSGLVYLNSPVTDCLRAGLSENLVINPLWMDDRYSIPLAADYLAAAHLARRAR